MSHLYFGGYDALTRIVQDTLEQARTIGKELKALDRQVAKDKAKAQARLAKVQKINAGISTWNDSHPEQPTLNPRRRHLATTQTRHRQLGSGWC